MCDLEIKSLFNNLLLTDDKKRTGAIGQLVESFKTKKDLRNDIIICLLKYLGSVGSNHKEILKSFRCILESMDNTTLDFTISQLKEHLFLNKIKDATKKQLSINKFGSLLAFDALFTTTEITKIDKSSLTCFYKFVLSLIDDNALGFLAIVTAINFFKKVSPKSIQSIFTELEDKVFSIDNLEGHPQYLLLWLYFTDSHKKILKSLSKTVPSLQSKIVLNKLPNALKLLKDYQLKTVMNYLAVHADFPTVWKYFCETILKTTNHITLKPILFLAFEAVCPQPDSPIDLLPAAKRGLLMQKIWGNQNVVNLILRNLATADLSLNSICRSFVAEIGAMDVNAGDNILEQFFKIILKLDAEFINQESKINRTSRLSIVLLRHTKSVEVCSQYTDLVEAYFHASEKNFLKIYALEQLSAAFVCCPARQDAVLEMLLRTNYQYNHKQSTTEPSLVEAARAALLRCLDVLSSDNLEKMKEILTITKSIYDDEELSSVCGELLKIWAAGTDVIPQSKKRSASQRNEIAIDLDNKTNAMFISLIGRLCFYMSSQPLDAEMMAIIDDIKMCFQKFRGVSDGVLTKTPSKRSKAIDTNGDESEAEPEKNWTIVLTDVLIVLLEQSCNYLRTLAVSTFKSLMCEGHCTAEVIEHINATIDHIDTQSHDVDKKRVVEEDADLSGDEEAIDSEVSDSSEDEEIEQMEVDKESDLKARIFAALGSVMADVHSDSDDNCPDVEESEVSSDEDDQNGNGTLAKPKVTLKAKRQTILQYQQFKNRCIDLLDTVFIHSPKLGDRLSGFLSLLRLMKRSNIDMETRLLQSIQSFKKHQTIEEITTDDIISHINQLLEGVQGCPLSKNVLNILGSMMMILLRMKKDQLSTIVNSFQPIMEQCVTEKKKHSMKAIFLATFDKFPQIGWAFHQSMLNHIDGDQPESVKLQAIGILRKIVANPAMKSIIKSDDITDSFVLKSDVLLFLNKFGAILQEIIMKSDIQNQTKYLASIIGSLTDCLKLGGGSFYQTIGDDLYTKIKTIQKLSKQKEVKRSLNQFIAAVDCVKKSLKNVE